MSSLVNVQGTVQSQDILHYRIHQGISFACDVSDAALGAGGILNVLVRTGTKSTHMRMTGAGGEALRLQLFEATTVSADGVGQTTVNRNRDSSLSALTTVFSGPTLTAAGTELSNKILPAGVPILLTDQEYVLAASTQYLARITNLGASSAAVNLNLDFYEL